MLADGQIWANGKFVAKVEKHEEPGWKCILLQKNGSYLKLLDVIDGPDEMIIEKIKEHQMKLSNKSIIFS